MAYCEKELDVSDDEKKGLERSIKDLETVISEAKESIQTLADEIVALEKGIKNTDKAHYCYYYYYYYYYSYYYYQTTIIKLLRLSY